MGDTMSQQEEVRRQIDVAEGLEEDLDGATHYTVSRIFTLELIESLVFWTDHQQVSPSAHVSDCLAHQADVHKVSVVLKTVLAIPPLAPEDKRFQAECCRQTRCE